MAVQKESAPPARTAQLVAEAFVGQYFHVLHQSPELLYRFYQDSSLLSRQGPDGVMSTVTTMQGINEKLTSMDYIKYKTDVLTCDAQDSCSDGVFLVVTGLSGEENARRKFIQSFFLAPQNTGFFVLNDVFRYVDNDGSAGANSVLPNVSEDHAPKESLIPSAETTEAPNLSSDINKKNEASQPPANGEIKTIEKQVVPAEPSQNDAHPNAAARTASSAPKESAPKKSFASIVNALKDNSAPFQSKVPLVKPPVQSRKPAQAEAPVANAKNAPEKNQTNAGTFTKNQNNAVKGHSVFVGRLPMSATVDQLREAFERFGPIKFDGIQVRSNKPQGLCFGFVEFEAASSMENALKADDVMVSGSKVNVEEAKKNRDNNDRGRFPQGRGGYRNDNFRGNGNFGGRGGRNEFERRSDFSGRNRRNGDAAQRGEAYSKGYQNGGERAERQGVNA